MKHTLLYLRMAILSLGIAAGAIGLSGCVAAAVAIGAVAGITGSHQFNKHYKIEFKKRHPETVQDHSEVGKTKPAT